MIKRSTDIKAALRSRQRGFLLNPFRFGSPSPGPTDPYFDKVAVLCHFDSSAVGPGGENFFVDQSLSPKSIGSGTSSIDATSAQSRFGSKSLYIPGGTGVWPSVGLYSDFNYGTDDFCIELSVRPDSTSKAQAFLAFRTSSEYYWMIGCNASGFLRAYNGADGTFISDSSPLPAMEWSDITLSRKDGTFYLFKGGDLIGSHYSSRAITPTSSMRLGYDSQGSSFFSGYIDELRITIGEYRYNSSYTHSGQPFPNH